MLLFRYATGRHFPALVAVVVLALTGSWMVGPNEAVASTPADRIKSFCIDFNWGPGGTNGFPRPGTFAQADPKIHYQWYKDLGANVIQTFCVSCNGYAWYKESGVAPVQPGLKHDFLPEITQLAHQDGVKVMGYFCVGANTYWAQKHPDQSYGAPSDIHIPLTREYVDYLSACIKDALTKTKIDGFMLDWFFSPPHDLGKNKIRWLDCEKRMYAELFARPFPGADKLDAQDALEFQRRALDRCWRRVHDATKAIKPDCVIWLSCFDLSHPQVVGSALLREADWVMNETPTPEKLDAVRRMVGPHATLIQCLSGGGGYDAAKVLNNPRYGDVGLYGFAPQPDPSTTLPPDSPQEAWQKVLHANIEELRKAYHGAEYTVGETPDRITIATPQLEAAICKKGYVSGVAAQSFRDKKTGFRDPGFGLDIVDWIMEPGSDAAYRDQLDPALVYHVGDIYHGNREKRSIEGPQICTQAHQLQPVVIRGTDFVAIKQQYQYRLAAPGKKTGSVWTQVLVFPVGKRYFISMDKIDAVNSSDGDVSASGHAGPHQAPPRRHVQPGLPELSGHDPGQRVLPGLSAGRQVQLPSRSRRRADAHDPRLPTARPEDRQAGAVAGGNDVGTFDRQRGLVPPARLRVHDRGVRRAADPGRPVVPRRVLGGLLRFHRRDAAGLRPVQGPHRPGSHGRRVEAHPVEAAMPSVAWNPCGRTISEPSPGVQCPPAARPIPHSSNR